MAKYTLVYFNGRGRAETIRLIFAATGVEYVDKRIEFPDWPALKPTTPSGTLPVMEVGDQMISDSGIIGSYVAKETGVAGKDNLQQAKVDEVVAPITDLREACVPILFEKDDTKKADLLAALVEKAAKILETLEKKLQANKGGKAYFVGDDLTWGDLHFISVIEPTLVVLPDVLDKFPGLKDLKKRVEELPNVAKYLKERPVTKF